MAAQLPEQCATCRYFHNEYAPAPPGAPCDSGELRCDAFPDGIPWPIQEGEFDHTMPHIGDHGIQYVALGLEPPPEEEPAAK
jgi:hypothetical protein